MLVSLSLVLLIQVNYQPFIYVLTTFHGNVNYEIFQHLNEMEMKQKMYLTQVTVSL